MTPECRKADERLLDYAYQELPDAERAEVAAHVEGCGRCSAELAAIAGTRSMLRALPDEDPPPAITARLLHEAAAPRGAGGRLRALLSLFALHPAWSLSTAAAVVLVGVFLIRDRDRVESGEPEEVAREAVGPAHEQIPAAPVAVALPAKDEPAAPPAPAPQTPALASRAPASPREGAIASRTDERRPRPKKSVGGSGTAAGPQANLGRGTAQPFLELAAEPRSPAPESAMGAGSGAGAPMAEKPTVGDDLDSLLKSGASSADKLQRRADAARKNGDCPEALRLYRQILTDYPGYSGKAEVERGIRACQAAKAAPAPQNK